MLTIRQKLSASLGIVFFFGCATLVSAAGNSDKLSDAREMLQRDEVASAVSSLEKALPPFIASQDYWSVSKAYFQLAVARGRLNETRAGCAALSKSVDYYRQALVKDKLSLDTSATWRQTAATTAKECWRLARGWDVSASGLRRRISTERNRAVAGRQTDNDLPSMKSFQ